MIKLQRPPMPAYLYSPKVMEEKKRIIDTYQSSSKERLKFNSSLLNHIRNNVKEASNHKCAFCETRIGISSDGHIEHFRPKGGAIGLSKEYAPDHYFWLAYEWDNLMLACQMCSVTKKNLFPIAPGYPRALLLAEGEMLRQEMALLIDPFYDYPELSLRFLKDGTIIAIDEKGAITIDILKLNRAPLVNARKYAIDNFINELLAYENLEPSRNNYLNSKIMNLFSHNSDYEYSAALREIYKDWKSILQKTIITLDEEVKKDNSKLFEHEVASINETTRFTIKSIEIENFRSIEHLKLNFLETENLDDEESWLLMLGDNGIGKSAILQAIALTLCGPHQFNSLNIDPADIYKNNAQKDGFIKIYSYEKEEPYMIQFNQNEYLLKPDVAPTTLLAYGATRLLPKGNLKSHTANAEKINIANLFDYSISLLDAKAWLLEQSSENFDTRIIPVLIDLLGIKGTTIIDRTKNEIFVGGNRLSEISDGYKSVIAVACDIMQSLSQENMRFHETPGLVLIDELGNHLHPKWRLRIVSSLRKAFPKLQFIVSTHEPLCLRGLKHGEVVVLITDRLKKVIALDSKVLPDHNLLRIDQLLTSDLFGLLDTNDPATESKFDNYYKLLVKPKNSRSDYEKEEIKNFTQELYDKEIIGSSPQTQILFKLINENFAKNLIEDRFKTKEELKSDTIKTIQDLINDKKIDWL